MPVLRYFLFVGAALLGLLFAVDAVFPKAPAADHVDTAANALTDISIIRIQSAQKWPDKVEFDTSLPTITPPAVVATANVPSTANSTARIRDTFALLQTTPPQTPELQAADAKKPEPKLPPKRRIVASKTSKSRAGQPVILVAQQPHFGLFPNTIW